MKINELSNERITVKSDATTGNNQTITAMLSLNIGRKLVIF